MLSFGRFRTVPCLAAIALVFAPLSMAGEPSSQSGRVSLDSGWQLQSSCDAKATAEQISTAGFDAASWHKTTLPNTVVGSRVDDKTLPDPTYGTNLASFPGMPARERGLFANAEMPEGSPYLCSWWFRKDFTLPASFNGKNVWIHFPGINYRANVWVNGQKIGDARDIAGTFRIFEFNIGKLIHAGKANAVALEIFAPQKDDLGITWVDWNPTPPDRDMGIWKEVYATESGDVALRHPFATSTLSEDYKSAQLTLSASLENVSAHPAKGTFEAEVAGVRVSQPVGLAAGETRTVYFRPEKFPALRLSHPRLWWPYTIGEPYLYNARFSFSLGKQLSDSQEVRFGIREVTSELTGQGYRLFTINGRKILIRGAAWAPDMFLRKESKKLAADLAYVKHMGLNTIRLEGRIDRDEFFDKTDELGILVMPGWTCCDAWERWDAWKGDQREIAAASMDDQARRLRNHPSVYVWLYGSDGPPPADIENMYLDILKKDEWPVPSLSSASDTPTVPTGPSGVKMTGPYEYVPPVYWYADTQAGGAFGYNTETSPGPAIPTKESLEKFIPKDHLWPIDSVWNYHAGGERFTTVNIFTDGLTRRYGAATSLDDYERKAQAMAYDGERAMFEAYGRNKYTSTGVIQWMLNNSWPSLIWHLYDYYLVPAGGYFGTRKAMEPVHIQYGYNDNSVDVVNGKYEMLKNWKAEARIFGADSRELYSHAQIVTVASDSSITAFDLPAIAKLSTTYFLKLRLFDPAGKLVSDNFYWLSTKKDTLDWAARRDTVYTPQKDFADLTGLNSLPEVTLQTRAVINQLMNAETGHVHVTVKNPSESVAFQIRLRLATPGGDDVVPIFWDDNYFSLLPGEERQISAAYDTSKLHNAQPKLQIGGYNVKSGEIPAASTRAAAPAKETQQ